MYQPDSTQSSAPYISQVTIANTAYTAPDTQAKPTQVVSCNSADNTITVPPSAWGPLQASTAIIFGSNASSCGLTAGVAYYIVKTPAHRGENVTFQISQNWIQEISSGNVPIANTGAAGPVVTVTSAAPGATLPNYAILQPVSQLGSQQITSNSLVANTDGSYTIWLAPPQSDGKGGWNPPPGVTASNWIPTPSTNYFQSVYSPNSSLSTAIRPMIRTYYPMPGDTPPSILPYSPCPPHTRPSCATYVLPALVTVPQAPQ
jgi:hypothetical protein